MVESNFNYRLGYGTFDMQPEGSTMCGSSQSGWQTQRREYFGTISISDDLSSGDFQMVQFNQASYTDDRFKAGFICETEDVWGCHEGYLMMLGKCYKLFKEKKTQIEAQMACRAENATVSKPQTFVESEFLESLVSYHDDNLQNDPIESVWLSFRRGDINESPDLYFFKFGSHSDGNLLSESGDCLAMTLVDGVHKGWHRKECNSEAYFICEKSKFEPKIWLKVVTFFFLISIHVSIHEFPLCNV